MTAAATQTKMSMTMLMVSMMSMMTAQQRRELHHSVPPAAWTRTATDGLTPMTTVPQRQVTLHLVERMPAQILTATVGRTLTMRSHPTQHNGWMRMRTVTVITLKASLQMTVRVFLEHPLKTDSAVLIRMKTASPMLTPVGISKTAQTLSRTMLHSGWIPMRMDSETTGATCHGTTVNRHGTGSLSMGQLHRMHVRTSSVRLGNKTFSDVLTVIQTGGRTSWTHSSTTQRSGSTLMEMASETTQVEMNRMPALIYLVIRRSTVSDAWTLMVTAIPTLTSRGATIWEGMHSRMNHPSGPTPIRTALAITLKV